MRPTAVGAALLLCLASACGSPHSCADRSAPPAERQGLSIDDLPLLKQPHISVQATALVQNGRRLEIAALLTNTDRDLDGRKGTVSFVALGSNAEVVSHRTVEFAGVPANAVVAISEAIDLERNVPVSRVQAFVGFGDAAIRRDERSTPLAASGIRISVDGSGALVVTGRVPSQNLYPGRYRVDAVIVDRNGAIVGSARSTDVAAAGPDAGRNEWMLFAARGHAKPGTTATGLRPVVTILPIGGI